LDNSISKRNAYLILWSLTTLSGCLFDSNEPRPADLTGNVVDGPIVSADVTVFSREGKVLASTLTSGVAGYGLRVNAYTDDYPLTIEATGGIDLMSNLPPEFPLVSVALDGGDGIVANANTFSALIVSTARLMDGGITEDNVAAATMAAMSEFDMGLDTLADGGPITTPIDHTNLAELIRSSTALAEVFKRSASTMLGVDGSATIGSVMQAVASDLVDGRLDGVGGPDTSKHVSAVTILVNGQVTLETIINDLHVAGRSATTTIDEIVGRVVDEPSVRTTGSLAVTDGMIESVRRSVDAALAVEPTPELEQLSVSLDSLEPDMASPETMELLGDGTPGMLDRAIKRVAAGLETDVDAVVSTPRGPKNEDGGAAEDTDIVTENSAPILDGTPPRLVTVGTSYQFAPESSDPDGDPLVFSVAGKPTWAEFSAVTGMLWGIPESSDVGTTSGMTITATDGIASTTIGPFRITVEEPTEPLAPNSPPEITGEPPATVVVESLYEFLPTVRNDDGDELLFEVDNRPAWLAVNTATGLLRGIPAADDVGVHDGIVIRVTDRIDSDALGPFSITVEPLPTAPDPVEPAPSEPEPAPSEPEPVSNTAPTISGNPPSTVEAGSMYRFVPSANDADGDSLEFDIINNPVWASFNTSTGELSGVPSADDVGTFSNIVIQVGDGTTTSELPTFEITVEGATLGNTTLSWMPPTENADGSPLLDLAGFYVYWGTDPQNLAFSVAIDNPGITSYVVEGLTPGTYYFAVTAFNADNMESTFSNTVNKTF
jgi:hypothetical protein